MILVWIQCEVPRPWGSKAALNHDATYMLHSWEEVLLLLCSALFPCQKSSTFVSTVQTRFPGVLLNIHIETCFSIFGSRGFLLPFLFNKDFHGRAKIVHCVLRMMFAGCLLLRRVAKVFKFVDWYFTVDWLNRSLAILS